VALTGRILLAHGARAAEAILLGELDVRLAEAEREPALLRLPLRVVVPSTSLRDHLLAAIVARRGRAAIGLLVQTLFGLAAEILERRGEPVPRGEPLLEILAQREGRREPALRRALDDLREGWPAIVGTVRDLLDAGLEPEHAEAAVEALAADGPAVAGREATERARALVRTAAGTESALRRLGRGRISNLLRQAADLLATDAAALPARAVFVHGFADATGLATDLIQALLRQGGAQLILDHPPKPGGTGYESAFTARFGERLRNAADLEEAAPPELPPVASLSGGAGLTAIAAVAAIGGDGETREVARRIALLLAAGARPEWVGVVARDLTPYRFLLARRFTDLGIPFTAPGEPGALSPAGRRCTALLSLLRDGEATPTDRWLDARATEDGLDGRAIDLRLALLSLGASRLRAAAELPLERLIRGPILPLPIRQGLGGDSEEDGGEGAASSHAARRSLPAGEVRGLVRAASRLMRHLAGWPAQAPLATHVAHLHRLLREHLGWSAGGGAYGIVAPALQLLATEIPAGLRLGRDEVRQLLERRLEPGTTVPLGGAGGGVQLLTVTEARGRTFEHLFLVGLNRGSFPRAVREDALLPDELRRVLQRVLPDVPIKLGGFDEERYLFAQLLSAAPEVVLSWQESDDDGRPIPRSPLVDLLRGRMEVVAPPGPWSRRRLAAGAEIDPHTAAERATLAALYGPRDGFARLLPIALREQRTEGETGAGEATAGTPPSGGGARLSPDVRRLAAGRLAVLNELDPDLRTAEGRAARARLGPYFGFLGRLSEGSSAAPDPRRRPLYVTLLERLAACPWQLFLGRLLGIEPTPDPTGLLPGIEPSLLGRAVHGVLEQIGKKALADLEEGRPPAWPAGPELEVLARRSAEKNLAEEGILLAGLANALAAQSLPYLEAAYRLDWQEGAPEIVAVEREEEIAVRDAAGAGVPLRFRADRVDRTDRSGRGPCRTDYKTGAPLSTAVTEEARRRHLLAGVRAGTSLQTVAYLLAGGDTARGRYLYLRPDLVDDLRELAVTRDDEEVLAAFDTTVATLLGAWREGSLFPRLADATGRREPLRCGRCTLAEACLRGDSGARLRLVEATGGEGDRTPRTLGAAELALVAGWRLGGARDRNEMGGGAGGAEELG
jgi:RecB family exonuclease